MYEIITKGGKLCGIKKPKPGVDIDLSKTYVASPLLIIALHFW